MRSRAGLTEGKVVSCGLLATQRSVYNEDRVDSPNLHLQRRQKHSYLPH